MSEFAEDQQKQSSKQSQIAHHKPDETAPSSASKVSKPNDAVLTRWSEMDGPCSSENAPVVCATQSEKAPEPVPAQLAGHFAKPSPVNWSESPALATAPTTMLTAKPVFRPASGFENGEAYQDAFSNDWSEVASIHNGIVSLHQAYKHNETDVIPILQVGGTRPVGAGVQGVDATKSFVGGKLKPALTQIDSSKLSAELRAQIFKGQDKLKSAELDYASKSELAANATFSLTQAHNNVDIAANQIEIVKSDTEIENLALDKDQVRREVENFKAKAKAAVESAKLITSILTCWMDPKRAFKDIMGAVSQGATATGAIAEAAYTVDANAKLAHLDGQIRGLRNYKGGLLATNAEKVMGNATLEVLKKINESMVAVRAMQAAKLVQQDAYRDMGTLIEKAGAASGLNPKDRKAVAGAVEAVPKIDRILLQLAGMEDGLQPPEYSETSGVGAAMASNLDTFTRAYSVVKGNRAYVAELKALWEARRASVMAVVEQSVSVSGAE